MTRSLVEWNMGGIRGKAKNYETPLCQSLLQYDTRDFDYLVYRNVSLFGGKWKIGCQHFVSTQQFVQIEREIQRRQDENLMQVWKILCPLIEFVHKPGPALPEINDAPDAIKAWMKANPNLSFGITLELLPLSENKQKLLKIDLEELTEIDGRLDVPLGSLFISPTLIETEDDLKYRLAEDLSRLFNYGPDFDPLTCSEMALSAFKNYQGSKEDLSIDIYYKMNGEYKFVTEVYTEKNFDHVLHFYFLDDLTKASYFDQIELRARLEANIGQKLISLGFSKEEIARYRPSLVDDAIFLWSNDHVENMEMYGISSFCAINCNIVRNQEGVPELDVKTFFGTSEKNSLNMSPVTLRLLLLADDASFP